MEAQSKNASKSSTLFRYAILGQWPFRGVLRPGMTKESWLVLYVMLYNKWLKWTGKWCGREKHFLILLTLDSIFCLVSFIRIVKLKRIGHEIWIFRIFLSRSVPCTVWFYNIFLLAKVHPNKNGFMKNPDLGTFHWFCKPVSSVHLFVFGRDAHTFTYILHPQTHRLLFGSVTGRLWQQNTYLALLGSEEHFTNTRRSSKV